MFLPIIGNSTIPYEFYLGGYQWHNLHIVQIRSETLDLKPAETKGQTGSTSSKSGHFVNIVQITEFMHT
jgi:hypothetical protein